MKNVVVTVLGVLVLAIAMATAAFGAQTGEPSAALYLISDPLATAARLQALTGTVGSIGNLPSTSTGGSSDGMALAVLGIGAAAGGALLMRKAVTEK